MFNKAKTTLQNNITGVWEELHRRCSYIFSTDCFLSQLPFGLFFWGLFPRGCFKPRACFFFWSVNCFFPLLHTRVGAPTLSLFWQHSTVCVLYKTICFVSVQEHNARLLSLTVGKAASLRYHHLIQQTPLVPSLLLPWKAFVVQLLLFFCLLASCWHCKSETVAPSGASTTVAPGTVSC